MHASLGNNREACQARLLAHSARACLTGGDPEVRISLTSTLLFPSQSLHECFRMAQQCSDHFTLAHALLLLGTLASRQPRVLSWIGAASREPEAQTRGPAEVRDAALAKRDCHVPGRSVTGPACRSRGSHFRLWLSYRGCRCAQAAARLLEQSARRGAELCMPHLEAHATVQHARVMVASGLWAKSQCTVHATQLTLRTQLIARVRGACNTADAAPLPCGRRALLPVTE